MPVDISRVSFVPRKNYSSPIEQQGRVALDADGTEAWAIQDRHWRSETYDLANRVHVPVGVPDSFLIDVVAGNLVIHPGRLYVDGLQAENHGDAPFAFDPLLAETRGTTAVRFDQQPYRPGFVPGPSTPGRHIIYLDVWQRTVTPLQDPSLIEPAIGVDTTGRVQTVWQVRDMANADGANCSTPDNDLPGWTALTSPSAGRLSSRAHIGPPQTDPCLLPPGSGYTGLENRTYRVEIHDEQPAGTFRFKWAMHNATVASAILSLPAANTLVVSRVARDDVLRFNPGDWVEVLDDRFELEGQSGIIRQIQAVDDAAETVTLAAALPAGTLVLSGGGPDLDQQFHPRIRKWDQAGVVRDSAGTILIDLNAVGSSGLIPVPAPGTWVQLNDGVEVSFDVVPASGRFRPGDYWIFTARTVGRQVEALVQAPPLGIHHHYCRLAVVDAGAGGWIAPIVEDCRPGTVDSAGEGECGCCCTVTVGDGVNSFGKYASINDAINALPADSGGEVCILPGLYFENVFIGGRRDVVLRGCGWQTRIASALLKSTPAPAAGGVVPDNPAGAGAAKTDSPPFVAVITISQSQHVKLLAFAVEAAKDEVGVLIDGTGKLSVPPPHRGGGEANVPRAIVIEGGRTFDVTVEDLVITASTVPAILADSVTLFQVVRNRIAMENIASRWPAVWVSGTEIRIVHNWLGIQTRTLDLEWLPATVQRDIVSEPHSSGMGSTAIAGFVTMNPGGIQIAGMSTGAATRDVFVNENEIDIAGRNGITLGSLAIFDAKGNDTGTITGTTVEVPGPCDTTIALQIPTTNPGQPGSRIVAAGHLVDIQINRNRIRNTGACGIGPVGFFDPDLGPEIVAIQNLSITANAISHTLLREVTGMPQVLSGAFGAICIPFVEDLIIRDNVITDFGSRPGDPVCGIFVLYGQIIDISRNQVLETRDWNLSTLEQVSPTGIRGGIVVVVATPPSFTTAGSLYSSANSLAGAYTAPSFVPGVPALRVEHNVVRVASGDALEAGGFGPFSIVNNHLSTAGTFRGGGVSALAQTVFILNLGISIEFAALGKFSSFAENQPARTSFQAPGSGTTSNGAVTFTENMCQLEGKITRPHAFSSVMIVTLDDLIFGNNQCWMDAIARPVTAALDAMLVAGFVQVTSNRFQEVLGSVLASGFISGLLNITGQNISSHCLFATGLLRPALLTGNLSLFTAEACDAEARGLKLNFTES